MAMTHRRRDGHDDQDDLDRVHEEAEHDGGHQDADNRGVAHHGEQDRRREGAIEGGQHQSADQADRRGRQTSSIATCSLRQEKTSSLLVLPWLTVPALVKALEAARARRRNDGVTARTFFPDGADRPWRDADAFRNVFNELRDRLAKQNPHFETSYDVRLGRETSAPVSPSQWSSD